MQNYRLLCFLMLFLRSQQVCYDEHQCTSAEDDVALLQVASLVSPGRKQREEGLRDIAPQFAHKYDLAKKYEMTEAAESTGALCNDGSPGVYYLSEGSDDGANKWIIFHDKGGWCESIEDCYNRSKTSKGSTKLDSDFMDLSFVGSLVRNPDENPLMYNWNHVLVRYCDGSSFTGNSDTTAKYNDTTLYFRGKRISEAVLKDLLEKRGLNKASDVVISGGSAGGLNVYFKIDQWCDTLHSANPVVKCVGLPDSGFFLDYQDPTVPCSPDIEHMQHDLNGNLHCALQQVYRIHNSTAGLNQDCIAAHPAEEWKCMFPEHFAEHIRTPIFAAQSRYDDYQINYVQGNGGDAKTRELGENITSRIQSAILANNESAVFLDSCRHHGGLYHTFQIDGDFKSDAIYTWYNGIGSAGAKKLWFQNASYPCDTCC